MCTNAFQGRSPRQFTRTKTSKKASCCSSSAAQKKPLSPPEGRTSARRLTSSFAATPVHFLYTKLTKKLTSKHFRRYVQIATFAVRLQLGSQKPVRFRKRLFRRGLDCLRHERHGDAPIGASNGRARSGRQWNLLHR